MTLKPIYRIEHTETKTGIFQTRKIPYLNKVSKFINHRPYLKTPFEDRMFKDVAIPQEYVFGCESILSLKQWVLVRRFQEDNLRLLNRLKFYGFSLAQYAVNENDIVRGLSGLQVAFNPHQSRQENLYEYRDILELFKDAPRSFTRYGNERPECFKLNNKFD